MKEYIYIYIKNEMNIIYIHTEKGTRCTHASVSEEGTLRSRRGSPEPEVPRQEAYFVARAERSQFFRLRQETPASL